MNTHIIQLTEEAFDKQYRPIRNHLNPKAGWAHGEEGGCLFETYGKELQFVRWQEPSTVWTLVDGDDGGPVLVSGFHRVNRVGYLISSTAVPEGVGIQVPLPVTKRYNVHLYREMKLRFDGIEATSPEAAANIARDRLTEDADDIEPCDGETLSALVDFVGDDDYSQSVMIDFEAERERKSGRASALLLDMIRYGVISLADGDAEFNGTIYAFDSNAPDWQAVGDAIGWEIATAAAGARSRGKRHDD